MKFFLDSANLDEIRRALPWGIIDGVTTNPSLIAKEGVAVEEQIRLRVLEQCFHHPLTEAGLEQFLSDHRNTFDLVAAL